MLKFIENADHVAFLYCHYGKAQGRIGDNNLLKWCKDKFGCYNDRMIQYCIKKFGYQDMRFSQLTKEYHKRGYRYPITMQVCICKSCHSGTSATTDEEIETQIAKYGKFICQSCEDVAKSIGLKQQGKYLVSNSGVYEDEGVRPRGTSFLGFGGSWHLIRKNERAWITNNLFILRSLSIDLLPLFKSGINAEIKGFYSYKDLEQIASADELVEIKKSIAYEYFAGRSGKESGK